MFAGIIAGITWAVATIDISFNTRGKSELTSLIERLGQIDNVIDIERTTGG